MKTILLLRTTIAALFVGAIVFSASAQETIIFDASLLEPHDDGYYKVGVWKDKDNDGILEPYKGCVDEYGDSNHIETGTQQGFDYENTIIMPDCEAKGDKTAPDGYIQLTKSRYLGTDSAVMGAITTPPIVNLESLEMILSSDISINANRHIYFWIEYTKDNGKTWEFAYIKDEILNQGGETRTYAAGHSLDFDEMIEASGEGPIRLRILTDPQSPAEGQNPQRLKVHLITLVAEESEYEPTNVDINKNELLKVHVKDRIVMVETGKISVFNILGRKIGSGTSVTVPNQGIYIVKTDLGLVRKVYIE